MNRTEFIAKLEKDGFELTRLRLREYDHPFRRWAQEWLGEKVDQRLAASDASQAEQIDIARSAKDAAWLAALEAREANRLAKRANAIAVAASIIAIVAIITQVLHD